MIRRMVSLIICLLVLLAGMSALSEGEIFNVQVNVTFGQTEARSMLDMINQFRTGSNAWYWNEDNTEKLWLDDLKPLVYDSVLEQIAMQRAVELAVFFDHTRTDNTSCFTAYKDFDIHYLSRAENIAGGGFTSARSVFTAWQEEGDPYSGQGHRRNMLSRSYNRVGIGHVKLGGYHFWTQEFAYVSSDTPALGAPNNSAAQMTIQVSEDLVTSFTGLRPVSSRLTVDFGKTAALPAVRGNLLMSETLSEDDKAISVTMIPSWVSADPLCAVVGDSGVTGRALGVTALSAAVRGQNFSVPVTVRFSGRLTPDLVLPDDLKTAGDEAFSNISATAVRFPEGLTSVGNRIFAGSSVRQVTFTGSRFTVAKNAFAGCPAGITVFCPDGSAADALAGISGITVVRVRPSGMQ